MTNGYTRSPKLLKGAFVKLSEGFIGPVPNIIVFQYNPETMSRDLAPTYSPGKAGGEKPSTSEPFDPGESFSLSLELDAADALEEPYKHPVAVASGVADRIAAIEMLLYPASESLLGEFLPKFFGSGSEVVPRGSVPVVLFVWGPGRIVPVRIKSFKVEEEAFSPLLFPIRAKVDVGLEVLTDDAVKTIDRKKSKSEKLATVAYKIHRGKKETLARANMANSVESILGMLPF